MEGYWQGAAAVMLAVFCVTVLGNQSRDIALVLTVAACCFAGALALSYLQPVVDFIMRLKAVSNISPEVLQILLKAVGIGFVGEIACLICMDSGHGALAKGLQMLTSAVILWLSIPLLDKLLELIQGILGEV